MDNKSDIEIYVLQNWLSGCCTRREEEAVERWLEEAPENINLLKHMVKTEMASFAGFDQEKVRSEILNKIETIDPHFGKQKKESSAFWWFLAAAAVLVFLSAGLFSSLSEEGVLADEIVFRKL